MSETPKTKIFAKNQPQKIKRQSTVKSFPKRDGPFGFGYKLIWHVRTGASLCGKGSTIRFYGTGMCWNCHIRKNRIPPYKKNRVEPMSSSENRKYLENRKSKMPKRYTFLNPQDVQNFSLYGERRWFDAQILLLNFKVRVSINKKSYSPFRGLPQ